MIYLNALDFQSKGVKGRTATLNAPGEPFEDGNQNGRWDTNENWVNLDYPTSFKGQFVADSTDRRLDDGSIGASAARLTVCILRMVAFGLPETFPVSMLTLPATAYCLPSGPLTNS